MIRFPERASLLLLAAAIAIPLLLVEGTLRFLGERPGASPPLFLEAYRTDSRGVFRANPRYWAGWNININSDGFRGVEFSLSPDARSILLLGNSFTWGASAEPLTQSFADLLLQKGYRVYNTGIAGVSTNQYLAIGQELIPRLHPAIVAVMFCMNDLSQWPLLPGHDPWYPTVDPLSRTEIWIPGFRGRDTPMTAPEAYDFFMGVNLRRPPISTKAAIRHSLQKTVLGSRLYRLAWTIRNKGRTPAVGHGSEFLADRPLGDLTAIKQLTEANGGRFFLFLIPPPPPSDEAKAALQALRELDPIPPPAFKSDLYTSGPNPHFNNMGHRQFADFIDRELSSRTR